MKYFGFYVLNLDPLVLSCLGTPQTIPTWATGSKLFEHATWYQGYWLKMLRKRKYQMYLESTGVEHHLLVNSPGELRIATLCGVRAEFVSQNVYCDEKTFSPKAIAKRFDAVYIAKLEKFKRHELAEDIENLAVLKSESADLKSFCPAVSHAWTNDVRVSECQVAEILNASRCSLALSQEEGAMFASFESLLCGIPVVSTPSRGGRHVFFDASNSITVPSSRRAIAEAVISLKLASLDPSLIREKALRDLNTQRSRYGDYLATTVLGAGTTDLEKLHFTQVFLKTRFAANQVDALFVDAHTSEIPCRITNYLQRAAANLNAPL